MYLAIDIGGTKTLIASLSDQGIIEQTEKFDTPLDYSTFLGIVQGIVTGFGVSDWLGVGVGVPAPVNYKTGSVNKVANLPWQDVAIRNDIQTLTHSSVQVENDANLAGLSEAMLVKDKFNKVLYITISTGIGSGIIINQRIVPELADSEPGHMFLDHDDELQRWETFASGRAIYQKYGQYAHDIYDTACWQEIATNLGQGLLALEAILQPDVIILGGSIGTYFDRYREHLKKFLEAHVSPQVPARTIMQAQRPEEAVLFGCYDLARQLQPPKTV